MTAPLPLPLRVLVKGPSTVNWLVPMGGPRSNMAFPRVIEDELALHGRPSHVQALGMASERVKSLLGTWQDEVLNFSPDVIIILDGTMESVHLFIPRWLERHANSLKAKDRPITRIYRTKLLKPFYKTLARIQAKLDRTLDPTLRGGVPRRVIADLEKYIRQTQRVASPLVILFDHPPNELTTNWFPGLNARLEVTNAAMADMVRRIDKPNVRFFRLGDVVDKYFEGDIRKAIPDGLHYSPAMHRTLGRVLTDEIREWAVDQPHLALDRGRQDTSATWPA